MFWKRKKPLGLACNTLGAPGSARDLSDGQALSGGVCDSPAQEALQESVKRIIDGFRPFMQADGGDIDFVGIDGKGIVKVRMKGACAGCPSSVMTLQMGIERHLRERLPQVRGVVSV